IKAQLINRSDAPPKFEPLLPGESVLEPLLERASDLTRAATALGSSAQPVAQTELRGLLRSMNSYYSNRIEGEHTRPSDIERALHQDYSSDAELARKQRLAVAHIRTEQQCEEALEPRRIDAADSAGSLYSLDTLMWLHAELFGALPPEDLDLADGSLLN